MEQVRPDRVPVPEEALDAAGAAGAAWAVAASARAEHVYVLPAVKRKRISAAFPVHR